MTLSCPGPTCPMCLGTACNACSREPKAAGYRCLHDRLERHQAIPAIGADRATVPQEPISKPGISIACDLDDPLACAEFLEAVAGLLRAQRTGRIRLIVE